MIYSQKEIYDYLCLNPLNAPVMVGDVEDLNGRDYIFLDFTSSSLIPSDDRGVYKTSLQITVFTYDFENRKILEQYVKDYMNVRVTYDKSDEFEYYLARCEATVLIYG